MALTTYFMPGSNDKKARRPLLIYGAGRLGREIARSLKSRGISIEAFIDASAGSDDVREGVSAYRLSDWTANRHPEDFAILVCIHNPFVNVARILNELRSAGFAEVLTLLDYVNANPEERKDWFWIAPSDFFADNAVKVDAVSALLADDVSRNWFDANMRLRRTGEYAALPQPSPEDQYVPADIRRWRDPIRLIDCGAFDGDTIYTLMQNGYSIEETAAFEPDQQNYAKLAERFGELDAVFLPCGVSSATEMMRFDSGQGTSSRIDRDGDVAIQCVTIDEALPAFGPTLIKMDIEGAEPDALRGAERTIRRYRPALAISLYHAPDHLWEIPLWIAGLGLDYRMYMRGHAHNGFDLVMYCLPL
jgi:FkbM family methyltransferase